MPLTKWGRVCSVKDVLDAVVMEIQVILRLSQRTVIAIKKAQHRMARIGTFQLTMKMRVKPSVRTRQRAWVVTVRIWLVQYSAGRKLRWLKKEFIILETIFIGADVAATSNTTNPIAIHEEICVLRDASRAMSLVSRNMGQLLTYLLKN